MTRTMSRNWLVILVVIVALTVVGILAGCGNSATTTTTAASTSTSTGASTATSTGGSTDTSTGASTATTAAQSTGTTLVQGGKTIQEYKDSIAGLEKAVTANPKDLDSLESLGVAYYQTGQLDQAIATYQKILAVTDDAFIRNALGNVYRDQKKYDLAEQTYLQAIQTDPTLKYPYINLALLYKTQGQLDKATAILAQAKKAVNSTDSKSIDATQQMLTTTTTAAGTATTAAGK